MLIELVRLVKNVEMLNDILSLLRKAEETIKDLTTNA